MTNGAICASPNIEYRAVYRCPRCKTRRRFLMRDCGWWGGYGTCCTCGVQTGEDAPQPTRSKCRLAAQAAKARAAWPGALTKDAAMDRIMEAFQADKPKPSKLSPDIELMPASGGQENLDE